MTRERIYQVAETYMKKLSITFKERQLIHRFVNDFLPEDPTVDKIEIVVNGLHKMVEDAKL